MTEAPYTKDEMLITSVTQDYRLDEVCEKMRGQLVCQTCQRSRIEHHLKWAFAMLRQGAEAMDERDEARRADLPLVPQDMLRAFDELLRVYQIPDGPIVAAFTAWAARVMRECMQTKRERDEARANYQFMVDKAADHSLTHYRELGATAAEALNDNDDLRAKLAAAEQRIAGLETKNAELRADRDELRYEQGCS